MEGYGRVYTSSRSKLDQTEILIRIKFKPRKWIGAMGWDIDRQQFHCYASRTQRHKHMRFGWEHIEWSRAGPLEPLCNLRRKR
jgi:hypothetical protein